MLPFTDDKVNTCEIYNHIISKKPNIGDYIITEYSYGIVCDANYSDGVEYFVVLCAHEENRDAISYFTHGQRVIYIYPNEGDSYCVITKELFNLLLKYVPHSIYNNIIKVLNERMWQCGFRDYDTLEVDFIWLILFRIHNYLESIISDEVDRMILLSFGVKEVVKRFRNTSKRVIKLGNGQVWLADRVKKKGFCANQIRRRNKKALKKNKTVHYMLIERLS